MLHSFTPQPIKAAAIAPKTLQIGLGKKLTTSLSAMLKHLWLSLKDWVSNASEPKVWQKCDRHGNVITWYVFDPQSGYTTSFSSELEVRLWLEQHHF